MVLDIGRVKHRADLMHRSVGSNGLAIPSNWRLSADGLTNTVWTPESAGGSVSYGSNSNDVGLVSAAGASSLVSRADHVHRGVRTITSNGSNGLFGDVNLSAGTGIALGVAGQSVTITNTGSSSGGGGGSGTLSTVEEVDGSPTDSAVTKLVFPNGTLAIASHVATYTPAGGGGGGITHSFLGYNTIGGSAENMTLNRWYAKAITPGSDCQILSIGAYLGQAHPNSVNFMVGLWTDASGVPGEVIAGGTTMAGAQPGYVLNSNDSVENARWFHKPISYWLSSGVTYWIGVMHNAAGGGNLKLYYDTGTDRRMTTSGGYLTDWAYFANDATDSRKYSIRADVIA